jgi:L-alanine-DL-glutamate epimerase-like enolase superfamily enzyme
MSTLKIERIELFPVRLPIGSVLTLPRGASRTIDEGKQIILVKMTADDGTVGWGESGPSRRWSAETTYSTYTTLKEYLIPVVDGRDAFDIAGIHQAMNTELAPGLDPGQPVAKAGIDLAVHDLVCKKLGINLQSYLGAKGLDRVPISYLVSAPDPEAITKVVEEGVKLGYKGFKVKVGHNPTIDLDNVKAALAAAPGCVVWPDANQGYNLETALRMARAFEDLGIEVFEQPIPMTEVYGMKKLLSSTTMNISLDEAAMGIPYLIELIRREAVEGIAIKINKVGGIFYARQMCDLARNAGFKIIGSGLMDAPIGFQASVQLFSAYGIDFPSDLNGPQHLTDDYLAEPLPKDGQDAIVTTIPGIGYVIDEDRVKGDLKLEL